MVGHMKFPRGPHAARGPRVGQHCSRFKETCAVRAWVSKRGTPVKSGYLSSVGLFSV